MTRYEALQCPECGGRDVRQHASFATEDGADEIYSCRECPAFFEIEPPKRPRPRWLRSDHEHPYPVDL